MNLHREALDSIERAARGVKEVADQWNAVDLAALSDVVSRLEGSAEELKAAFEFLNSSDARTEMALRPTVLEVRREAARIERLVGAAAAFLRGAPGLTADEYPMYQAGGAICGAASLMESRGIQG